MLRTECDGNVILVSSGEWTIDWEGFHGHGISVLRGREAVAVGGE